tara:strand:+ start:253 stop:462 length:210 start_codon:yes stop_codon:yes gene_type:complete
MTAKEKAKELLKRFLGIKKINPESITRPYNYQEAKQCALICVDEMLAFDLRFFDIEFLKEVKQEIEKLK